MFGYDFDILTSNEQRFYDISGVDYCTGGVLGKEGVCNPAGLRPGGWGTHLWYVVGNSSATKPALARHRRNIIMLCKDYDIRRYKPTL